MLESSVFLVACCCKKSESKLECGSFMVAGGQNLGQMKMATKSQMKCLVSSLIWHFPYHRVTHLYCKMQGVWQGHRTCMYVCMEKTYYTGMVLKRKRRHIIPKNFFLQLGNLSEDGADVPDLKGKNELQTNIKTYQFLMLEFQLNLRTVFSSTSPNNVKYL